jgi:hypothetical protein
MNLNTFKLGLWWLFKATVLVGLSVVVIFLSSPKAHAATITGDLITSGGVPVLKLDDTSIVSFTDSMVAGRFWTNVGNRVRVDCALRNSIMFELKSVVVTDSGDIAWEDSGAVLGDRIDQGGGVTVTPISKIEGSLLIRHSQLSIDTTPVMLYGGYTIISLDALDSTLTAKLSSLAHGYDGHIVAEGELIGLTMKVDDLWVDGVQWKQTGFIQ